MFTCTKGNPFPVGTTVHKTGVNFSIFSRNASSIKIQLYEKDEDSKPCVEIDFDPQINRTGDLWHIFIEGIKPGFLYMYRIDGPYEPEKGNRFDPRIALLDPYAKALSPTTKRAVIISDDFAWQGDKPLNIPLNKTIIYETHLKGFTVDKTAAAERGGTYAGFTEKIPYLKDLGITAVELLPVAEFDENDCFNINPITKRRNTNYWGYSTQAFFAPKASYAFDKTAGACVAEFKTMVKQLHKAGIEVILDIVLNHTAEGNQMGPTLSFKGIENSVYYILAPEKQYYMDFTGCGNTVNCNHPVVSDFIIDCLHYWVLQMHVDGFRFDLASVLTRGPNGKELEFPPLSERIAEDPILTNTKIIAEPWDAGGLYQMGKFPSRRWSEWNDRYRDDIRRFWRGDTFMSSSAATRLCGSSDLFEASKRKPYHSINFITCHDGFTLYDLVSYNTKHNKLNGEDNKDGSDINHSYNNGLEGETDDKKIQKLRRTKIKNFLLSLFVSVGTPMLLGGDEFLRTQQGNNNAYCQDNTLSWFNWDLVKKNKDIVTFVKRAIQLRFSIPFFTRKDFLSGGDTEPKVDIHWYKPDGTVPDWEKLNRYLSYSVPVGKDDVLFLALNTDFHDMLVILPALKALKQWYLLADTSIEGENSILPIGKEEPLENKTRYVVPQDSFVILISKTIEMQ